MERATYIRALRRVCIASCSAPFPRGPSSTDIFGATFLVSKSCQKTKRHWALAGSSLSRFEIVEAGLQSVEREGGLVPRDHERRRETDYVLSRAEHQQAALECGRHNAVAQFGRRHFGFAIAYQLDAQHQAESADIADVTETGRPIRHAIEQVGAHFCRVADQACFEKLNGGE